MDLKKCSMKYSKSENAEMIKPNKNHLIKLLSSAFFILIIMTLGSTCFAATCGGCGRSLAVVGYLSGTDPDTHSVQCQCINQNCSRRGTILVVSEPHRFRVSMQDGSVHLKTCTSCGFSTTEAHDTLGYTPAGYDYHFGSCSVCGYCSYSQDLRELHIDSNGDNICDVCNYRYGVSTPYEYSYTGDVQTFIAPKTGTYKLEVWGGQGGYSNGGDSGTPDVHEPGGLGGYASGEISLNAGDTLYIAVGGVGTSGRDKQDSPGGWNGGGIGTHDNGSQPGAYDVTYDSPPDTAGGGGGATHIASVLRGSGVLSEYESYKSNVLIVAGGGGGACYHKVGGTGGGLTGGTTDGTLNKVVNQTEGYAFGVGQNGVGVGHAVGVGGGRRWLVWRIYQ